MQIVAIQLFNGLVYGMLLFLMSAGLSLIFGLMNVVNISHGSFFMLGAFVAVAVAQATGSFWVALAVAWIPAVALGAVVERVFLRTLYARGHLDQVLLTFGFTFVFTDLVRWIWGPDFRSLDVPAALQGAVEIAGALFPIYRLFLVGFGAAVALGLWLFLDRSRLGAMVRAAVDDSATAAGLGINVSLLFAGVFALGVGLAALGGAVAAPVLGVYSGLDIDILIPSFIVVVIGGTGSLRGAFIASLFVGLIDTLGKAYFPDFALFVVYLLMVVMLLSRPHGLFGIARA
ncbi:MAG TPA: branched-chain amino acid ABC transporter permease [Alphaproteobacteria bacterium]